MTTIAGDLASVGAALRDRGLTPRALAAWAGTDRPAALVAPERRRALVRREPVPAAATLALFVAGADVELAQLRLDADHVDALLAAGLVARDGARLHPCVTVLPQGHGLVVCDRADADDVPDLVCWPDDSSLHLARALPPGRRDHWIDLGTGSAFAPLARPELATAITGVDLNPRAVRFARLGAALSGTTHLTVDHADVGRARAPAALVTCNAPILGDPDAAIWRRADPTFFDRLWPAARGCVAPGGELVVHARLAAIPENLVGQRLISVYTPAGEPAFAVLWWQPDAPTRLVRGRRELTIARPHVDHQDRLATDAETIAPLDP